jgi:hypothetical protein
MREVFERLEMMDLPYFLTGSEALARYGQPRQTMDVDVVLGIEPVAFATVARAFETDFVINEPIDFGGRVMASLVAIAALGKVDLILGRDDPWGKSAMSRRQRWDHPEYGLVWVSTLEDLILAKLEWSSGTSELQLRDCRNLIAVNRPVIDWPYLERWASLLGVGSALDGVRDAT